MLNIFRHLCFITTRLGTDTLSEYTFVYLAAIDILSQYPMNAGAFLKEIQPSEIGRIPRHPLDRNMDFFFLTAAEQLTFILDANVAKELLTPAASPYLSTDGDPRLLPIFEAAHSVMLNLLAAPHNADLAASQIESYARLLFQVRGCRCFALPICTAHRYRCSRGYFHRANFGLLSSSWYASRRRPH